MMLALLVCLLSSGHYASLPDAESVPLPLLEYTSGFL